MRKFFKKIGVALFAGVFIVFFGTIGIDAVDNRDKLSESIFGRLLFGKSEGPCPADMVLVEYSKGDFCIDRFEVSLSPNCSHPNPQNSLESKYNIDDPDCEALSEIDKMPWVNLTENQALLACRKDGKRLPTNAEWSEASLGTPDPSSSWGTNDCQVANNWSGQPGTTGSGQNCESFSGAMDMIGNVWEWVDGSVNDGIFEGQELPKDGFVNGVDQGSGFPSETAELGQELYNNDFLWIKDTKTRTIARGGYWDNKEQAGQYSHYIVSSPSEAGPATGFRCVKDAVLDK
jgi:formylglycine-generating enzyme required for sulfatase activity